MTDTTEWSRYVRVDLNPPLPAGSILPATCDEHRSRFFIPASEPTALDRNIGLTVVLSLAIAGAVSIFYLSYRVAEILFGV